jgi:hypothetical protein
MANDEVKLRNTDAINQNIYSGKLINNYSKQFETLLMSKVDGNVSATNQNKNNNNNFSQFSTTKSPPIAANRS